jgi:hypothetical protein
MALVTTDKLMSAGEREARSAVIHLCRRPTVRRVADGAFLAEALLGMIGVVRTLVIWTMATPAVGWQIAELPIDMTGCAIRSLMRSGKREGGLRMVEGGRLPLSGSVTDCAVVIKLSLNVIGALNLLKIGEMAGVAIRWQALELAVHMAGCAIRRHMRSRQGESSLSMIESRGLPLTGGMTDSAIVIKLPLNVTGSLNLLEIGAVTGVTVSRQALILAVHMTGGTIRRYMRSSQGESSLRMIEGRGLPLTGRMAACAIVTELLPDVVRILNLLKVGAVAGVAIRSCAVETG